MSVPLPSAWQIQQLNVK